MYLTRSFLLVLLLGATAIAEPEIGKPTKLALPGGDGGIGFDDMMFSPSLHRVIAPAGRTGKLDLFDPKTQKIESIAGKGVDIIAYNPTLGHLYVPGGDSATLTILGVAASGRLDVLGSVAATADAHCVAADDAGHAYACDPKHGTLLVVTDPYPAAQ